MKTITLMLCFSCLAIAGEVGSEGFAPSPEQPVGWRGNGNGAWPGAELSVTSWSAEERVRWKTELPGWGHSSPIVVDDLVITTCEPWAVIALDRHTGKEQWTVQLNPLALKSLPAEQVARYTPLLHAARMMLPACYDGINTRAKPTVAMAKHIVEHVKGEKFTGLREVVAEADPALDAQIGQQIEAIVRGTQQFIDLSEQGAERRELYDQWKHKGPRNGFRDLELMISRYTSDKWGIPGSDRWTGEIGWTFATPITDGERIYVSMGQGQVAALSPQGEILWARHVPDRIPQHRCQHIPSPLLVDGVLIVQNGTDLRGFDRTNGETVWETPYQEGGGYRCGTAKVLNLDGTAVLVTARGTVLRARDGKVLCESIGMKMSGSEAGGAGPVGEGDMVYFFSHGNGLGVAKALRLHLEGDSVEPEVVWQAQAEAVNATPVLHNGIIYTRGWKNRGLMVIDAGTGEIIQSLKGVGDEWSRPSLVLAGDILLSPRHGNPGIVYTCKIQQDGRLKRVGSGRLAWFKPRAPDMEAVLPMQYEEVSDADRDEIEKSVHGGSIYGVPGIVMNSTPTPHGTQLYIRSISHLWCIGRP